MPKMQVSLSLAEKPVRLVKVEPDGTGLTAGYTKVGTYDHPENDKLGHHESHVLYHHVQEILYHVTDTPPPPEEGFWPDNITDMQTVKIIYEPVEVATVTVAPTTASVVVGATQQLTPTVEPADAWDDSVTYESSDEAKATVSATGLVTGVAAGSATITVKSKNGKEATSEITVTAA